VGERESVCVNINELWGNLGEEWRGGRREYIYTQKQEETEERRRHKKLQRMQEQRLRKKGGERARRENAKKKKDEERSYRHALLGVVRGVMVRVCVCRCVGVSVE
jgi:hypothetical protein